MQEKWESIDDQKKWAGGKSNGLHLNVGNETCSHWLILGKRVLFAIWPLWDWFKARSKINVSKIGTSWYLEQGEPI